jgi:outer membrane biosynthesis protein TonB
VLVAGTLGLAGALFAGAAYAADAPLDQANDLITKAVAVLKAAENPDPKNPKQPFEGHRHEALELLTRAQAEIAKAKQADDQPAVKEPKGPTPEEPKGPTPKEPKGPTPKEPKGPTPKEPKGPVAK